MVPDIALIQREVRENCECKQLLQVKEKCQQNSSKICTTKTGATILMIIGNIILNFGAKAVQLDFHL